MVSKSEIVKRLLEDNIYHLNRHTYLDGVHLEDFVSIKFEKDKYFVYHKKDLILQGDLLEIDTNYDSQKQFILRVANEIAAWAEDYEELDSEYFHNYIIHVDNKDYFNILGEGDIFKNYFIDINFDEEDDWDKRNYIIEYYIDILKEMLDEYNNRVVLYESCFEAGFYIDCAIREADIYVEYIEDPEDLEYLKKADKIDEDLIQYECLSLYYKLNKYKELEKVINFFKK